VNHVVASFDAARGREGEKAGEKEYESTTSTKKEQLRVKHEQSESRTIADRSDFESESERRGE